MTRLFFFLISCGALLVNSNPLPLLLVAELGGEIESCGVRGPKPAQQVFIADNLLPHTPGASSVPVGQIITKCTQKDTVALTFDDGPYKFTDHVLDILKKNAVSATFFVNGQNYWPYITDPVNQARVKRAFTEGHQIASHTWSHANLSSLNKEGIESQVHQLENALVSIIGKKPTYIRPPYFEANTLVQKTLGELGYHIITADIDTKDYDNDKPDKIKNAVQNFKDGLQRGGTIELSHDVHEWTANVLVQAMIDEVKNKHLKAVTVGECLDDPKANWYRSS